MLNQGAPCGNISAKCFGFLISNLDQRQQQQQWLTTNIPTMPHPHLRQSHEKVSKMSCNVLGLGLIQTSNALCSELLFAGIKRDWTVTIGAEHANGFIKGTFEKRRDKIDAAVFGGDSAAGECRILTTWASVRIRT
jgi:hypothetical protein